MKKRFKTVFILLISIVFVGAIDTYAATPTLEQIAEAFNNSDTVKEFEKSGASYKATAGENKITITTTAGTAIAAMEFPLEGTILKSGTISQEDESGLGTFLIWTTLVDSIGTLHGYKYGDLKLTLASDDIVKYTLENEGYEVKKTTDNKYEFKTDISKKIPLLNFSNTFITEDDLAKDKDTISGNGSIIIPKGNVLVYKKGYDNDITLVVGETNELTDNAYKSLLSAIKVMFNSTEVLDYFKTNYPKITTEAKTLKGMKIEYNPTNALGSEKFASTYINYKFLRITINKKEFLDGMKPESKTKTSIVKVPDTAQNLPFKWLAVGFLLTLGGAGVVYYGLYNKQAKQEF